MSNKNKIILDLCGGTGSWSKPYKDAGYDVRVVTIPENDVRIYNPPENVYGILSAPPCTVFSLAGNWIKRTDEERIKYSQTPIGRLGGKSEKTKRLRSITPTGFANAFFEANK